MAVITPQSDVYLIKVPLEIDNNNQLTFASASAQYNYFSSLPKIGYDDFTYIRKDGVLRIPAVMDDILSYNYVMYRNDAYSDKWFYAYITGMEYVNDSVTDVSIATDTWQTWQFALTYKPTFIEREHVNDDTIGKHTIPENLEIGTEYVTNGQVEDFGYYLSNVDDYCIVVDVSMIENEGSNATLGYNWTQGHSTPNQYVNGIPSGLYHIIIGYYSSVVVSARDLIDVYDYAGLGDAIQNVYILPKAMIGEVEDGLTMVAVSTNPIGQKSCGGLCMPKFSRGVTTLGTFAHTRPTTIDGYTPKNNKLFCYPYNFLNVTNNAGTTVTYNYEDFSNGANFTVESVLAPSGSWKATPNNYKNIGTGENGYEYSINGAKFPMCSWTTDSYTNWLTQNAVNQNVAVETTGLSMLGSIATGLIGGGAGGAIIGAIGGTISLLNEGQRLYGQQSRANVVPDQAKGNVNSGDILWSKYNSRFTFLPMSIKKEYAECVDSYFNAFGYKVSAVKTPNITGRRNWNYVKTVGCYIEADIPQDDLQQIKEMFNKGITFWHNPATFCDYSQNNDII